MPPKEAVSPHVIAWDPVTAGVIEFSGISGRELVKHANHLKKKFGDKLVMILHTCRKLQPQTSRYCLQIEYEQDTAEEGERFKKDLVESFKKRFGKQSFKYEISHKSIEI